jgi:flavocytochrome c
MSKPRITFIKLLTLTSMALVLLSGCLSSQGTYIGEGEGRNGKVVLSVGLDNNKINKIDVVESSESDFTQEAVDHLINELTGKDSVAGIDTYSGATFTSKAVLAAVTDAIEKSQGKVPAVATEKASSQATKFKPGTYTSAKMGRHAKMVIEVTFSEDKILEAKVLSHKETEALGGVAADEMTEAFVKNQNLAVDVITGATQSTTAVRMALQDAIKQAGGDVAALSNVTTDMKPEPNQECDVVVVGAGAHGMSTAIELKKLGHDVVLLEKMGILGGSSLMASTAAEGYGTKVHKRLGVKLTKEEYLKIQIPVSKRILKERPQMASDFADLVPETFDWMIDSGVDINKLIDGKKMMAPSDGTAIGQVVVPFLREQLVLNDVDVRTNSKAVSIINENGTAGGVVVETPQGIYNLKAQSVVLATGGYFMNQKLLDRFTPKTAHYGTTWSIGSTGDGLIMAEEMGAELSDMEKVLINPTAHPVTGKVSMVSFSNLRHFGGILVGTKSGKRFFNENAWYTDIANAMPDGEAYIIIDHGIMESNATIRHYLDYGFLKQGNSIAELAAKLKLDPQVLAQTIETYSSYAKNHKDEEFGRKHLVANLDKAPYYAAIVKPANHNPFGGVTADERGQAVRKDGSTINGLYVVGNVANNLLIPNGISGGLVFGRMLGRYVSEDILNK